MDAGIGEAAAAEGAKAAGEATAAETMTAAAASDIGGGAIASGVGTAGLSGAEALGASTAAGAGASTLAGDSATKAALYGAEGYGAAATPFEVAGGQAGLASTLGQGFQYANEAYNVKKFAENPSLQTGLNLGLSTAGLAGDGSASAVSPTSSPVGAGGADIPGSANPLTAAPDVAPTGTPTATPDAPATGPGGPGTSDVVTPPAGTAPPSGPSTLDKALNWMGDNKLQTANLGLGAGSLINNIYRGNQAQKQYQNIAAGAKGASDQLLAQFQSGQLTGADSYAIAQWSQQQKAQTDQYFAKAGLSNSSMHQQAMQQIDIQAEGMRQQAVQNLLKNGLSAAGLANPTLTAGVTAGLNSDQQSVKAMNDFLGTLAKMNTQQTQTGTPGG